MKAILSTLVLVATSSVALARPAPQPEPYRPVVREHRVEARHPWPERDHHHERDHRWERGRYVPRQTWRYERPVHYSYGYFQRPVVVRPFGQTYVFANQSTFVDQVMVTYDDGRVQTLPVGRYLDPGAVIDELGIDRSCAVSVQIYSRDAYGRSYSFAAL